MTTLSLAMIVRDAEPTVARALESVSDLCDEMIVVDTGSLDRTKEIAIEKGAKVHDFLWIDDFAAARNRSFALCCGDWILWLDADDLISEESRQRLRELKSTTLTEAIDGIVLPYQCAFTPTDQCIFTIYRERLLRRSACPTWKYPVHECIYVPPERALYVHTIFIEHRPTEESRATKPPFRNLKILEKTLSRGDRSERNLFYYANELSDHCRYQDAIVAYEKFFESGGLPWERYWAKRKMCHCYSALGRFDQAVECGLAAIAAEPKRAEAYNDLGTIYYKQNRIAEAISLFLQASTMQKPQDGQFVEDSHYEWLPYDYLSACYLNSGDYQRALEACLKAAAVHPDKGRVERNIEFLMRVAK